MTRELKELQEQVRTMQVWMIVSVMTVAVAVGVAALATDIFKVEYNGTTRFQVDDKGTATVNTDTNAAEVALRILSAPNARGDIRFYTRSSDPTSPQVGDIWFNFTEGKFKIYDGFKRSMSFDGLTQVVDDANATNNNDGTRGANSSAGTDDPTWTTDAKLGGCALSFDGSTGYMNVGIGSNLQSQSVTVEAWIKLNANNIYQAVVKYDGSDSQGFGRGYMLGINNLGYPNFRKGSGDGSWEAVGGSTVFSTGAWYHVVGIYDNAGGVNTFKVYVNGAEDGSSAGQVTAGISYANATGLTIGADPDGGNPTIGFFNGILDEVAIWNRALTPAEVMARYSGGAGAELVGNEAGLVSVWHMNDPK